MMTRTASMLGIGTRSMGRLGLLGLSLALSACAIAPGRIADLRDVGGASIGSGKGLSVDATLGALSQPSIGLYGAKTVAFGVDGREVQGYIAESRVSLPYSFLYARRNGAGFFEALNFTGWHASFAVSALQRGFEEVDKPLVPRAPREFDRVIDGRRYGGAVTGGRWLPLPSAADRYSRPLRFRDLTQLEAGAHVAIFAVRAAFNPLELADFLLGFTGVDIGRDDPAPFSAVSRRTPE
jgi:hypothetical protein